MREASAVLLGINVALILWITMLDRAQTPSRTVYLPFHALLSGWQDIQRNGITGNILGNIALFVPIGALAPVMCGRKKWWTAMLAGCGLSLLIEIMQLLTKRGVSDPDDVILNGLGTAIGYGILKIISVFIKRISAKMKTEEKTP